MERKQLGILLIVVGLVLLLVLTVVKSYTDEQSVFLCQAVEDNPDLTMDQCPAHEGALSWWLVAAFGLAFVITASGAYLFMVPETALSESKKEVKTDLSKLSDDERKIYDLLKENDNSMYQSDLIKETGFSKVKITRVLDKMSSKGIVDRQRRGMTNIVVLK